MKTEHLNWTIQIQELN